MESNTIQTSGAPNSGQKSLWPDPLARQAQNALLASVSHELRTPLTSITGCLSTLLEDGGSLDKAICAELVANAYQEAKRLNRVIGNLLDMARIASGTLRVNKSGEYVPEVVSFASGQFDNGQSERNILIEAPASIPLIPLDFELMVRAFSNVIENAIEYSPEGSLIQIRIICVGSEVNIQVIDSGVGINQAQFQDVFEKFQHPQEGNAGLGLGMVVSKAILEAHGGSMQISNRLEGGTIVSIILPLAEMSNTATAAEGL